MTHLLDLFCGEGGAGRGYQDAGFTVTGVDTHPTDRYPGRFIHTDALAFLAEYGHRYDAIHASPPCQAYSILRPLHPDRDYPDLVGPTRDLLAALDIPWVIENVPGAPLRRPVVLCGAAFGLTAESDDNGPLVLKRHRAFESNVWLRPLPCACWRYRTTHQTAGVYGHGPTSPTRNKGLKPAQRDRKALMGIDWMTRDGLSEAIPPAYTRYIGARLLDWINARTPTLEPNLKEQP